ncbi:hypothetical protein [Haliangium ochraceum]|uniref:Peptidase C39-like domain-containing protein n=1 Tax=Haliangium ochraceum (strain DSM 14365 / JCM 11303 / SMP-2) TaxID=502025 RepID=D0LHB7_HALO1|nr:hypothetical protein [Haliangium ochraceum]ACY18262.1 conserved hypothetical protein [Haliangium ochraceum DSM 14365]
MVHILPQPNDTTCGPTCLHAVYRFFGEEMPLERVIAEVPPLPTGGTLGVNLACHALERGYRATIYTYNLHMFDPTWFSPEARDLAPLLRAQRERKGDDERLLMATASYLQFLELGGSIVHREMGRPLLQELLAGGRPMLTGLSATYLYGCAREYDDNYDDLRGYSTGHFVVLHDYDQPSDTVVVADPLHSNPRYGEPHYEVSVDRLVSSILLGILTYDANLLVIEPSAPPAR